MQSKSPHIRTRVTSATARRTANIICLIAVLRKNDKMTFDSISEHLRMSPSGTRKYVRELIDADVLREVDHRVYSLHSANLVEAFESALALAQKPRSALPVKNGSPQPCGVTVHIMSDDTHYQIKRPKVVCMRDPLVAALFGSGPAVNFGSGQEVA